MSRIKFNEEEINKLLHDKNGVAAKHLYQTATKAERVSKRLCPVDTGRLRSSINSGLGVDSKGLFSYFGTKVEYALDVEFGTSPYVIEVKNKKVLANKKDGIIFGKKVNHPGTKAQPFLRPAMIEVTK